MQMWHPGDDCSINTSLFPRCHCPIAREFQLEDATKNLCYILKTEEAGIGSRHKDDRSTLAEYTVIGQKVFVNFPSQNVFHTFYNFVPMP